MLFQSRTVIRPKFENRQAPFREVLLVTDVLIADDEQIEPCCLSFTNQVAILELPPAHLHRSVNFMRWKSVAQLSWRADIQQDFHFSNSAAMRSQP